MYCTIGHIAEGAHPLSTLNATGSTKRTISSVIRSERAASGVGTISKNQIRKRAGSSMVEGSFGSYLCMSASWPVCCAWNVSESDSEREAKGGEDTTEWGNELL